VEIDITEFKVEAERGVRNSRAAINYVPEFLSTCMLGEAVPSTGEGLLVRKFSFEDNVFV